MTKREILCDPSWFATEKATAYVSGRVQTKDRAMIRLFLAALALAAFPALFEAKAAASPYGLWLTEKKGVVVDVYQCEGDALCARTVWLKNMTHDDGAPRLDAKNPDVALRDRHWCGIEVIRNVRRKGDGEWRDGKIYDPKTGETFDFDMVLQGETMRVRGYLGVRLLGKSETWTRADAANFTRCVES